MKRCPACKRIESDDALTFCRADGTPLVSDLGSANTDAGTVKFASAPAASELETAVLLSHATDAGVSRSTGPTTVLDRRQTISRTRELSRSKRTKAFAFAVAILSIAVIVLFTFFYLSRKNNAAIQSVAVLPFINTSGDPNMDYLSDGLTESVIYNLSQFPSLRIIPRSSVFRYKGKEPDPQIVSRELGVRAVLEGRVVQRGNDLLISVELIDTLENKILWGQQYNRTLTDALAMQQEISKAISERLRVSLTAEEAKRLTKPPTENGEAYQAYLKGRYYWNKRTGAGITKGIDYFQQAVALDPTYALAYTGLADSFSLLPQYAATPPGEIAAKAKAAASKAVELEPNLAQAHTSLAQVMWTLDWHFADAEQELRRAIELNPNYATAHHWLGLLLTQLGRNEDGRKEILRAQQLDPLSLIINRAVGTNYQFARQYDNAIAQYKKTLEIDDSFPPAHADLAVTYTITGRRNDALAEITRAIALDGRIPAYVAIMGDIHAKFGEKADANKMLEELMARARTEYVSPYDVASLYVGLGDKEKAFVWLDKAVQERASIIISLKAAPHWDSLRSDPRFTDLLRRVGLPQ
jgi:TolB-like protein/Flp pilus assembly protein TadD